MEAGQPEKGARRFEELWVWQQARELVKEIYEDFRSGPGSKDFGFRDQIQRAAISIINNISEGYERSSKAEFIRFLDIAKGSAGEVRNMLYLSQDLGYLSNTESESFIQEVLLITKGIGALRKYLKNNENNCA